MIIQVYKKLLVLKSATIEQGDSVYGSGKRLTISFNTTKKSTHPPMLLSGAKQDIKDMLERLLGSPLLRD